jgi:hypothetical protein
MPGDKQDTLEFQEKAVDNTQLHLDITFPNLNIYLPNKEFLEIVYNRYWRVSLCAYFIVYRKLILVHTSLATIALLILVHATIITMVLLQ